MSKPARLSPARKLLRKKQELRIDEWMKIDHQWRSGKPNRYDCELTYAEGLERLHAETINLIEGKVVCDPASYNVLHQLPPMLQRQWGAFVIPREKILDYVPHLQRQYILLAVDPFNPGALAQAAQSIKEQFESAQATHGVKLQQRRIGAGPKQDLARMAEALWAHKQQQHGKEVKEIGGEAKTFQKHSRSADNANSIYRRGETLLKLAKEMFRAVETGTWAKVFPASTSPSNPIQ